MYHQEFYTRIHFRFLFWYIVFKSGIRWYFHKFLQS